MENYNSETTKWMTLADANKGLYSNQSGDFGNSAELNQGLATIANTVATHSALGAAPEFGSNPTQNIPGAQLPGNMPSGLPLSMPSGLTTAAPSAGPGTGYFSALPQQMPSADMVSGYANPAMQMMATPSLSSHPSGAGSMPKQEVLMEPCTINQPLNGSLRESYSTGNFYFLPKP